MTNRLGYYAKNVEGDLFQFKWESNGIFQIKYGVQWIQSDPKQYEILEIGFFTADDK